MPVLGIQDRQSGFPSPPFPLPTTSGSLRDFQTFAKSTITKITFQDNPKHSTLLRALLALLHLHPCSYSERGTTFRLCGFPIEPQFSASQAAEHPLRLFTKHSNRHDMVTVIAYTNLDILW
jgi:hypothetical protein